MKKATKFKMLVFSTMFLSFSQAQTFFTEDFEGALDPGTNLPVSWTETGLSTDGIWSTGNAAAASSAYLTYPATTNGTQFAYSSDDACNCNKSADRIILPAQDFTGMVGVNLVTDIFFANFGSGTFRCEVSTDAGSTWTMVEDYDPIADPNAWVQDHVTSLNAYAGMSNVMISFLYGDNATWDYGVGIDQVRLVEVASAEDLAVIGNNGEYTFIPLNQASNMTLQGKVRNAGVSDLTDIVLTANVYLGGLLQTTLTSPAASILSGDTLDIDAGMFQPLVTGDYSVEYIVSAASITDANTSNDTNYYNFVVDPNYYARDNAIGSAAIGVNGIGNSAVLGNVYDVNTMEVMDTIISLHGTGPVAGDTIQFEVYSMNAGLPDVIIGLSEYYIVTPADVTAGEFIATASVYDVSTLGALNLNPGSYFVGAREFATTDNYAMIVTSEIYTVNKTFGSVNNGAWTPLEDFGFPNAVLIRPRFTTACVETLSSVTETACNSYEWSQNGAVYTMTGSYNDTILNAAGCDSVITLNLTIEILDVATTSVDATITATLSGASYQWIDCATNSDITGETGQSFTATVDGDYAVVISNGSCSDTSACTSIIVSGINENQLLNLSVYPNPSSGNFEISLMDSFKSSIQIELVDLNGKVLLNKTVQQSENLSVIPVTMKSIENGIYLLKVSADGYESTERIIISK